MTVLAARHLERQTVHVPNEVIDGKDRDDQWCEPRSAGKEQNNYCWFQPPRVSQAFSLRSQANSLRYKKPMARSVDGVFNHDGAGREEHRIDWRQVIVLPL